MRCLFRRTSWWSGDGGLDRCRDAEDRPGSREPLAWGEGRVSGLPASAGVSVKELMVLTSERSSEVVEGDTDSGCINCCRSRSEKVGWGRVLKSKSSRCSPDGNGADDHANESSGGAVARWLPDSKEAVVVAAAAEEGQKRESLVEEVVAAEKSKSWSWSEEPKSWMRS